MKEKFLEALDKLERTSNVNTIVELFSDDAKIESVALPKSLSGKASVYRFWRDYRFQFQRILTRFDKVFEVDQTAVLEWTSEGVFPSGKQFRYSGVTILEIEDAQIKNFRTYFDQSPFAQSRQSSAA